MNEMMTCRELVELVTSYLDGAMPVGDVRRFDEHIDACGPCETHLHQMRMTIQLSGRLTEENVSSEAKATLLEAFRNWKRASSG